MMIPSRRPTDLTGRLDSSRREHATENRQRIHGVRMAGPVFGTDGLSKACQQAMQEGATWEEIKVSFAGTASHGGAVMMPGPNGQPTPHRQVAVFVVVWPERRQED